MSSVVIAGDVSGSVTLQAPSAAGSTVLTLPSTSGTVLISGGSQTIEFADGSASAPSITNSGDTNTGIFFPAADTIAFTEGGVESMRIDPSGNVGIGTSSPSAKLTVSDGTVRIDTSPFSSTGYQGTQSNHPFALITNNTERMRIDSSGVISFKANNSSNTTHVFTYNENGGEIALYDNAGSYGSLFDLSTGATRLLHVLSTGDLSLGIGGANSTGSVIFYRAGFNEAMRINSSGYVFNAVNGLGNGLHQAYQYYRLNSGFAGANSNTAQPMLGAGVTLVANTVYEFEIVFAAVKTAGTTSHTISLQFGGTATLNNILYNGFAMADNTGLPYARIVNTQTTFASNSANALAITGAITAATHNCYFTLKGTVSVANGGTFIPQYVLSAAPGGAYTTQAGSYVKISALSASGSNTSIGTWA